MKKTLIVFILIFIQLWRTWAYSSLSESQLLEIDEQINSTNDKSLAEKKKLSDYFYWLAQKNLAIRKAFLSINTKIDGISLTKKDQQTIDYRIAALKTMNKTAKNEILAKLKHVQYIAEELWRLYEIESSPLFEGYWVALSPTPVFSLDSNNPDISYVMWWEWTTGLHLDSTNLIRELTVVYPQWTVFSLIRKVTKGKYTYYQVRTKEFDGKSSPTYDYYVDSRFIEVSKTKPKDRISHLPSREQVLKNLYSALGSAYVRWGSWYQGIPEMSLYFPSSYTLNKWEQSQKTLKGVDCSWLLYQATDGYTPRTSYWLVGYWEAIDISWNTVNQIIQKLKPLDLIVRGWHVIIVYDNTYVIESRRKNNFKWGVMLTKIKDRLNEIFETRKPVNNRYGSSLPAAEKFVVRRRY